MKYKSKQNTFHIVLLISLAALLVFSLVPFFTISKKINTPLAKPTSSIPEQNASIKKMIDKEMQLPPTTDAIPEKPSFQSMLVKQAELRLQSYVVYDGRYEKIAYPMGDVPENIGVCTDVVIRSYRGLGIDLQQRVHEDMRGNFKIYPKKWKMKAPDTNIDHRRVLNLMTYFKRKGASLAISKNPYDYEKGHIVTWDLGKGLTHIGIVSDKLSMITGNPLIIHNIGAGPEISDILFRYKITGHYRYE